MKVMVRPFTRGFYECEYVRLVCQNPFCRRPFRLVVICDVEEMVTFPYNEGETVLRIDDTCPYCDSRITMLYPVIDLVQAKITPLMIGLFPV